MGFSWRPTKMIVDTNDQRTSEFLEHRVSGITEKGTDKEEIMEVAVRDELLDTLQLTEHYHPRCSIPLSSGLSVAE